MNIVFLSVLFRHPILGGKMGGGEISNRRLLEELAKDHQVTIVSATGTKMWGEEINGVTYYDLSCSSKMTFIPSPLRVVFCKLFFRLLVPQLLKQIQPDIVLCSTLEYSAAIEYGQKHAIPVGAFIRAFENFREYNDPKMPSRLKQVLRNFLYGNTQNKGINRLDFLLPNSDFMDEKCKQYFTVPSTYVIYPPVDIQLDTPKEPSRNHNQVKSITMVSGAKKKGSEIFVKLSQSFPDIEFSIIGYRGGLSSEQTNQNLTLHGWHKHPEKLIAQADLVLVPSIWEEPFGRIAVEALQCGSPVLVSNIGGLPETVAYQTPLMVEANDFSAWQSTLKRYLESPAAFQEANRIAKENAQKYAMHNQIQTLVSAMKNEINAKREPVPGYT